MYSIDLRSDTVTKPTDAMRKAMADAEVGDDVFGEDLTVIQLEEMAADLTGKEKALFVASGTMANLVCQMVHCNRGDEMILGDQSHIYYYEQGGSAAIGGIHPRTVPNQSDGTLAKSDIEYAIRKDDVHFPRTKLIILENTHNRCGGYPLDAEYMDAIGNLAHSHGLKLHVDGARIFNAAVSLETTVSELVASADSVSFCLSKGLAAPVGSLVCGANDFVKKARRTRKVLGGGMRQAGVLAAPGIVALGEMTQRLEEDHENARKLSIGLADMRGLSLDPDNIKTNIVYFDIDPGIMPADNFVKNLKDQGIKMMCLDPTRLRAVIHYQISSSDIDHILKVIKGILRKT